MSNNPDLSVSIDAGAVNGNATVEQHQCTEVEQMSKINGTTEFGADPAYAVLFNQVGKVHYRRKFTVLAV